MRYSEDLIEEVRSRNNIVDVIGEYVKLKRTGSNYVGLCPFHNEKTGSFSVSLVGLHREMVLLPPPRVAFFTSCRWSTSRPETFSSLSCTFS